MRRPLVALAVAMALTAPVLPHAPAQAESEQIYFGFGERLRCPTGVRRCSDNSTSEPAIRVDPVSGHAWVTDQLGIPGGVNLWRRPAGARFGFVDKMDAIPVVSDRSGLGLGGGDSDIAITGNGEVVTTSLWAGGITLAAYDREGTLKHQNYLAGGKPNIDRQWIAPLGESTLFMSHWDFGNPPRNIWVSRSDDAGVVWQPPVPATGTPTTGGFTAIGNIVTDPLTGAVYTMYGRNHPDTGRATLWLSRSLDGGASFQPSPIWSHDPIADLGGTGPGSRIGTLFPVIAVDRASNLHVVWADGNDVWYVHSLDGGDSWTAPLRVNDRTTSRSSVFPWIAAGSDGRVGIAWFGSTVADPEYTTATQPTPWYAYYAQSIDAGDPDTTPTFSLARASDDPVHNVGICLSGLACDVNTADIPSPDVPPAAKPFMPGQGPLKQSARAFNNINEKVGPTVGDSTPAPASATVDSNRNLAEVVTIAVDVDGYVLIAYPDDFEQGAQKPTISVVSKQVSGPRLYAPGDFPNPDFAP